MNSAPTEGVRTVHLPQIKSTVPVYKNPGNCKRAVEFTHEQWQYACRKPACRLRGRLVEELQELVRCQFDLLVPPLRGSIVASDQPGAV